MYQDLLGKRILELIEGMPLGIQDKLANLVQDL
jgi:hypothetical protein